MRSVFLVALNLLAVSPVVARADNFTYYVSEVVAGGSISGTITTNVGAGTIGQANVTSYNLALYDGTTFSTLTPANSSFFTGGGLAATASGLSFNFSQDEAIATFLNRGSSYVCYQNAGGNCDDTASSHISFDIGADARAIQQESGTQLIASSAKPTGSYTYYVDTQVGGGSLSGTITSDTNVGAVTSSDITAFDLTLNDGTASSALTLANASFFTQGGITATPSGLFFDFSQDEAIATFLNPGSSYVCYQNAGGNCDGTASSHTSFEIGTDTPELEVESGTQLIAGVTAPPVPAAITPEPGTWALVLTGIGGLCAGRRRMRHRA